MRDEMLTLSMVLTMGGDALKCISENPEMTMAFAKWLHDHGLVAKNEVEMDMAIFTEHLSSLNDWAHMYSENITRVEDGYQLAQVLRQLRRR